MEINIIILQLVNVIIRSTGRNYVGNFAHGSYYMCQTIIQNNKTFML